MLKTTATESIIEQIKNKLCFLSDFNVLIANFYTPISHPPVNLYIDFRMFK